MSARHYSSANRVQGDAAILDGLSANRSYPETLFEEINGIMSPKPTYGPRR